MPRLCGDCLVSLRGLERRDHGAMTENADPTDDPDHALVVVQRAMQEAPVVPNGDGSPFPLQTNYESILGHERFERCRELIARGRRHPFEADKVGPGDAQRGRSRDRVSSEYRMPGSAICLMDGRRP